jgi:hypothetical protein
MMHHLTIEPIIVPRSNTGFTNTEIGKFIYHETGREPTRLDPLRLEWSVDDNLVRSVRFTDGFTIDFTRTVNINTNKDLAALDKAIEADVDAQAIQDVKRIIATGLTRYYKHLINGCWNR